MPALPGDILPQKLSLQDVVAHATHKELDFSPNAVHERLQYKASALQCHTAPSVRSVPAKIFRV